MAKLCRRCGDTGFLIPAAWAAARTARQSWRADSGSTGLRPGNSQHPAAASCAAAPLATRCAAVRAAAARASRLTDPTNDLFAAEFLQIITGVAGAVLRWATSEAGSRWVRGQGDQRLDDLLHPRLFEIDAADQSFADARGEGEILGHLMSN